MLVWPPECFDQRILGNSQIRRKTGLEFLHFGPLVTTRDLRGKSRSFQHGRIIDKRGLSSKVKKGRLSVTERVKERRPF